MAQRGQGQGPLFLFSTASLPLFSSKIDNGRVSKKGVHRLREGVPVLFDLN